MQLTPEQHEQSRQAKAQNERRATVRFTPDQLKEWREIADQEMAAKGENVEHFRKLKSAAEQPGFFGDVRRAILLSRRPLSELSAEVGISPEKLSGFRAGEMELPAVALDRLIGVLGLRLMQEIPR